MTKKIEIPKNRLERLYLTKNISPYKIAKIIGCDYTTINRRLKKYSIQSRAKNLPIDIPKRDIKEKYLKKCLSIPKIAKIYHCSNKAIYNKLCKYKIKIRQNKLNIAKREIVKLYEEKNLSTMEISKMLNCSQTTIINRLKKFKIKIRPNKKIIPKKSLTFFYIKKRFTIKKLCEIYNCSHNVIYRNLNLYKIKTREPNLPVIIPKDILRNLYIKKGLSSVDIAKKLNCSPVTIRNKLGKFNIPIRNLSDAKTIIKLNKENLKDLYINKRLSTIQIAKKMNCNDEAIRKRLHKHKIKIRSNVENSTIHKKYNFNEDAKDKSYLIGFSLGDLYVEKLRKKGETLTIKCGTTKQEQIDLIKNLFSKYGGVWISKPDKNNVRQIYCYVNTSFSFLLEKKDEIPSWAMNNKCNFFAFFAGYLDAEGHIEVDKRNCAKLVVSSYDKHTLKQLAMGLNYYGIYCLKPRIIKEEGHIRKDGLIYRKDMWMLGIYRKNDLLTTFKNISPYLKHKKRCKDMETAWNNILERNRKFGE